MAERKVKKPTKKEIVEKMIEGAKTEIVYQCIICKSMYDHPGMCHGCETVLKKKGG